MLASGCWCYKVGDHVLSPDYPKVTHSHCSLSNFNNMLLEIMFNTFKKLLESFWAVVNVKLV